MLRHPDRHHRLQGASNFRDLGGYVGDGGRVVRWRRVFRSDHLAGLTEADREALRALGVTRALDFRGVLEREATPYALPGLAQHALAIEPTVVQRMHDLVAQGEAMTAATTTRLMQDLYRTLALEAAPRFAEFFEHLLDTDEPLLFHCTAGKDRTGFAAALLLRALGVPMPVVMDDYLLTNELYQRPELPQNAFPTEAMAVLWRVDRSFLEVAFDAIESRHGSLDAYLAGPMGLSPAARRTLAERYLQPA